MIYAFALDRDNNVITINDFNDEQPGMYELTADSLNNIVVVKGIEGGWRGEIHTLEDTVIVNEEPFEGTAEELRTLLLSDIFNYFGDGEVNTWKTVLSANFASIGAVAASTTTYGQITGKAGAFGSEVATQYVISENCNVERLFVSLVDAQPESGSLVITLRVNGASTALSVVIPAGSDPDIYFDTVNRITLSAGDLICYQLKNNATDDSSAVVRSIGSTLFKTSA